MRQKPENPRVFVFFDGQNLFHAAKAAFKYTIPNFDPVKLAEYVAKKVDGQLCGIRFYTGIPDAKFDSRWHTFWIKTFTAWGRIPLFNICHRTLKYTSETFFFPDGTKTTKFTGREKGIDVRIAIDILKLARNGEYDIVVLFSQDQDLAEAALEIREIATEKNCWIRVYSAFPENKNRSYNTGIKYTEAIQIAKQDYDNCLDNNIKKNLSPL